MFSYRLMFGVLLMVAVVCGCASADKRFGQGLELETRGQYESATMRYVQALEKDPNLEEARIRLRETGALAVAEQLAEAEGWASRGDAVNAAAHFRRADTVIARSRSVGVRLAVPEDYLDRRRAVFDDGFEALVRQGAMAREQGRWRDGLAACRQARTDFEPTLSQRNRALREESAVFVAWSEAEYAQGHLRKAFEVAANVQEMEWSPPEHSARAAAFMADCLDEGEVELIVLPVQAKATSRREAARSQELASEIDSSLQQGPWRQPPAFVNLHEPLTVRDLVINAGILDGEYRPGTLALILRLAEADFAAYLQLMDSETTEFGVRSKTHNVKTRAGKSTTFVQEDGHRRIQAEARVIIADSYGNEIANVIVAGTGTAPFARGVYVGDHRELNLGSRQVGLFDRFELEAQEQDAREALVRDLTASIAGAVFRPTLAQIP